MIVRRLDLRPRGAYLKRIMAVLDLVTAPDPRLRRISAPVPHVDRAVRKLMDDMLETMYAAGGIGLAAIQVGEPKRLIVMDLAGEGEDPAPRFFRQSAHHLA